MSALRRIALALVGACALVSAARAQSPFEVSAEVTAGYSQASIQPALGGTTFPARAPELDDSVGGPVFGFRVGARAQQLGWRVALTRHSAEAVHVEFEEPDLNPVQRRVQYDVTSLDASAEWAVPRTGRARWVVQGGPSVVYRATDAEEFERGGATRLGWTAGGGVELRLGRHAYVRPDVQLRWIHDGDVGFTWESTVGVGWTFGIPAAQ